MDTLAEEGINWLDENENGSIEDFENKKKEIEAKVNPIMSSLYNSAGPNGSPMPDQGVPQTEPDSGPQVEEVD